MSLQGFCNRVGSGERFLTLWGEPIHCIHLGYSCHSPICLCSDTSKVNNTKRLLMWPIALPLIPPSLLCLQRGWGRSSFYPISFCDASLFFPSLCNSDLLFDTAEHVNQRKLARLPAIRFRLLFHAANLSAWKKGNIVCLLSKCVCTCVGHSTGVWQRLAG